MPSTAEVLGVNIPLLIFAFGVAVGSIIARFCLTNNTAAPSSSPHNNSSRLYTGILLMSLFFIVTLCLTIAAHLRTSFITAIVAVYFENALPWLFWWLMVEIVALASYPDAQQRLQHKQRMSCLTRLLVYHRRCVYIAGTVILTVLCIVISVFVRETIGLVILNFVMGIHLLWFLEYITKSGSSPTKDVLYSLGGSFWLFAGLLVCMVIGSILLGVFILIPYFFAVNLVIKIITIVLIKYTGAFALITILVAFPRSWIRHVRSAEIQSDMMESSHSSSNNNNAMNYYWTITELLYFKSLKKNCFFLLFVLCL